MSGENGLADGGAGGGNAAGTTDANNRDPNQGGTGANGSGNGDANAWVAGLSQENRTLVEAKKWASPDVVLQSYRNLEAHASKAIIPPGTAATAEEWNAFAAKLGRPDKPEGYEIRLPEGLPSDFTHNKTFSDHFRNVFHDAGLSQRQAQTVHDAMIRYGAEAEQGFKATNAERSQLAHRELVKDWGEPATDTYKRNQELANRAVRMGGGESLLKELKEIGALDDNGRVLRPAIAKLLANVGKSLYAEDALYQGDGMANSANNPWSDKTMNLTEQGRIIREDPERAKALIRSAGLKVETFFRP